MWQALAAGGASLVGDIYSAEKNYQAQMEANKTNMKLSKANMDFQREMAETSYQRKAADLKAAGLNPILAAGTGGATSGVTSSAARVDPTPQMQVGDAIRNSVNSAANAANLEKDLKQKDANLYLTKQTADQAEAQRELNSSNALMNWAKLKDYNLSSQNREMLRQAEQNDITARNMESKYRLEATKQDLQYLKYDHLNRRIQSGLGTVNRAMDAIVPIRNIGRGDSYTTERYSSQGEHIGSQTTRRHK